MARQPHYWRGGKSVVTIKPGEYRVGNTPPESGVYPNGKDVDISKMNKPSYQAVLSMLKKIKTPYFIPAIYHTRESKGKGFRWTRTARKSKADFEKQIRSAIARDQNINEFASAVMDLAYSVGTVMAWGFVEVR